MDQRRSLSIPEWGWEAKGGCRSLVGTFFFYACLKMLVNKVLGAFLDRIGRVLYISKDRLSLLLDLLFNRSDFLFKIVTEFIDGLAETAKALYDLALVLVSFKRFDRFPLKFLDILGKLLTVGFDVGLTLGSIVLVPTGGTLQDILLVVWKKKIKKQKRVDESTRKVIRLCDAYQGKAVFSSFFLILLCGELVQPCR